MVNPVNPDELRRLAVRWRRRIARDKKMKPDVAAVLEGCARDVLKVANAVEREAAK